METKEIKKHIQWFEFFTEIYGELYEVSGENEEYQKDLWNVYYNYLEKHDLDKKVQKIDKNSDCSVEFYTERLNNLIIKTK